MSVLCVWVFHLQVYVCTACMRDAQGCQKRVLDPSNWSYMCLWDTMWILGPKVGLLQEQQVLLMAEASFQPFWQNADLFKRESDKKEGYCIRSLNLEGKLDILSVIIACAESLPLILKHPFVVGAEQTLCPLAYTEQRSQAHSLTCPLFSFSVVSFLPNSMWRELFSFHSSHSRVSSPQLAALWGGFFQDGSSHELLPWDTIW